MWCANSDQQDNTNCFNSLSDQGVVSTPSLVTMCIVCFCMSVCVCVCMHARACACMYVHVYMCASNLILLGNKSLQAGVAKFHHTYPHQPFPLYSSYIIVCIMLLFCLLYFSQLTPCLDAIYNANSCPAYCRDVCEQYGCVIVCNI